MLDFVLETARAAGRKILEHYEGEIAVETKSDNSPITLADRAAHAHIQTALTARYPDIPVVSEEGDMPTFETRQGWSRFWLVDPLDGTKEFIKKNGEFTVNIALIEDGQPVLGVVDIPVAGVSYTGATGEGAVRYDADGSAHELRTETPAEMRGLRAAISRSHPSAALDAFLKKLDSVETVPRGSSLKFCAIADRTVDFYPRFGDINEWDTAAAHCVATAAGAVIVGTDGAPLAYNKPVMKHVGGFIAAASPKLLAFLLDQR